MTLAHWKSERVESRQESDAQGCACQRKRIVRLPHKLEEDQERYKGRARLHARTQRIEMKQIRTCPGECGGDELDPGQALCPADQKDLDRLEFLT